VVAAIGTIAGSGFPVVALMTALVVVATLVVLRPVERRYLDAEHPDDHVPNS
jgi:uncharacterized membrane protein YhiD involved in acid resistance